MKTRACHGNTNFVLEEEGREDQVKNWAPCREGDARFAHALGILSLGVFKSARPKTSGVCHRGGGHCSGEKTM